MHVAEASGIRFWGDEVYSNREKSFQITGADTLLQDTGIYSSYREYLEIDAPLPEYFEHLLTVLEK